jgi:hypothetical protein
MDRQQLNTQKRNRTQTIQSPTVGAPTHLRGNSLNLHELYNTYQGNVNAVKPGSKGSQGGIISQR